MDVEERFNLIRQVGEEIITEEDLKKLLADKEEFIAYDGFEPSGQMHIAQGILRAININKMIDAGARFKILVADWHAWANNKLGGDLEKIKTAGNYMIEVWKAAGMKLDKVEFVWASDIVKDDKYWSLVMKVAINNTVKRIIRTSQIMGRKESDSLSASQILYPCMQTADIFYLNVDVAQLGMDQRKVNVLAREIGEKIGYYKPIVVSHHMLQGLQEPPKTDDPVERATSMKMSKSNPNSAIFMTDSEEEVKKKINKAYCPEGIVEENPLLEYCKYIIFEKFDEFVIERPEKWGGNLIFKSYNDLEETFANKQLHPMDLKQAVAKYINMLLEPVRKHFSENEEAKKLLEKVKSYKITR